MTKDVDQEMLASTRRMVILIASYMMIPLFYLFWIPDLVRHPDIAWQSLGLHSLVLPAALLIHLLIKQAKSYARAQQVGLLLVLLCGTMISILLYIQGEGQPHLFLLQLCAMASLGLVPWSRVNFAIAAALLYLPVLVVLTLTGSMQQAEHGLLSWGLFTAGVIGISWLLQHYAARLRKTDPTEVVQRTTSRDPHDQMSLDSNQSHANESKLAGQTFLANISHEIRTPLTSIIGYAEQAQDRQLTNTERMLALNTIIASGNHLLDVVNDLLDYARLESNGIKPENVSMDPLLLGLEIHSAVAPQAQKKGLMLELVYDFPLPHTIVSDPQRLRQILMNLCNNAIKFTQRGVITLTLEFDQRERMMIYRVQDSGIGISTQQQEQIFEVFSQADISITRPYSGAGIGLALSRRLANMLGGSLSVNSQPDQGSEFILGVAAGDVDVEHMIENQQQLDSHYSHILSNNRRIPGLSGRILLAEDNVEVQKLIALNLRRLGLAVELAGNGELAVAQALQNDHDLIIMDMQMPVLSGLDAVRQLRARSYTKPIIALTANASRENRRECMQAGCNDFLTKPVKNEDLYRSLARYLEVGDAVTQPEPLHSSLSNQGPEFAEIVSQFIAKLPDLINSIETSFENNDSKRLKEVVHNLKGMGGGFGFPQLTEHAARIEKLLQEDNWSEIEQIIDILQLLCRRIEAGSPKLAETTQSNIG